MLPNMSLLRTHHLRVHTHQFLTSRSSFLSKLDDITARMLITYHFYKIPKMFVTRSIDKFSYRISTQGIIIVVEGRACDKPIDYFTAIRAGTEVYRS